MTSAVLGAFPLACPRCKALYTSMFAQACQCSVSLRQSGGIQEILAATTGQEVTQKAYKLYALFYAPMSLLAYWLVWRGNLRQHIKFFRETLSKSRKIVDIATGDGSLTKLAMFMGKKHPEQLLCIDISSDMLNLAKKKLPNDVTALVRGDVEHLPIASSSMDAVTCFGGVNSFPSMDVAFQEMNRILSRTGIIRGSALLFPQASWRRRLIHHWIRQGYQTTTITHESFYGAVRRAGLKVYESKQFGDVLLFELVKTDRW